MSGRSRIPTESAELPRLRLSFPDGASFRAEYERNLSQGGLFLATDRAFEPREVVAVELDLAFRGGTLVLRGEVVDRRPPELATPSHPAGVAVQILEPIRSLRERLLPVVNAVAPPAPEPAAAPSPPKDERRVAPRSPARLSARVEGPEASAEGRTRNVSHSGVLLSLEGPPVPVGSNVRVTLVHPTTGRELEVDGRVARQVENEGRVAAIAVEFSSRPAERAEVAAFVDAIRPVEHARRLGGIAGPIEELGLASLVQMFGACAPCGTLTLARGGEEGAIAFEGGRLRYARLGAVSGTKALARLLRWREGRFEFHARIDRETADESPCAIDAAIFEAMRQIDELARLDAGKLPPTARLRLNDDRLASVEAELEKTAQAVVDLVAAGFPWWRILDVIPEPDAEVMSAGLDLLAHGVIELAGS